MLRETTEILAPGPALRWRALVAGRAALLWLTAIVAASTVVRLLFALHTSAPWILPDELVYTHLARSLGETGHFAVREQPFSAWSFGPLYPLLLAPIFRFASPESAYVAVKTINCLLFSLAAVPAFFLARRVLSTRSAVILAGLSVLVPSAVYTSKVMTESLAYPLFLLAALMIVRLVETPSRVGELTVLAAIAAAALARGQLVVLFPAFVLTLVIVDRRRLAAYRVTWLVAVVGLAGLVASSLLGFAGELAGGHGEAFAAVSIPALAASLFNHLVEYDLYLGALPVAALAFVSFGAFRRGDKQLHAVCALAATTTVLLAASAARYLVAVETGDEALTFDRYVFYTAPLILIAFLAWLEQGAPRPRRVATIAVALAVCALPLALPYADLLTGRQWGTNSSTVGLVPWGILAVAGDSLTPVYVVLAVGGSVLGYFLCRRTRRGLLAVVVANFIAITLLAQIGNAAVSNRALNAGVGDQRSWIDAAVGRDAHVSALWSSQSAAMTKRWYTIWENEFFNRSVRRVYILGQPMRYALPQVRLRREGRQLYSADGRRFAAEYVLTDARTPVDGTRIVADSQAGMVLFRVNGPVSLR